MSPVVRPLNSDDTEALQPLDLAYSVSCGCEEVVDTSSLSFYARSGHAFVLESAGEIRGFVLGQAVWDGRRPTLLVRRLVASDAAEREGLLAAVTKSAYDSGVYDLLVELPDGDGEGVPALAACGYAPRGSRLFGRVLGTRGASPVEANE